MKQNRMKIKKVLLAGVMFGSFGFLAACASEQKTVRCDPQYQESCFLGSDGVYYLSEEIQYSQIVAPQPVPVSAHSIPATTTDPQLPKTQKAEAALTPGHNLAVSQPSGSPAVSVLEKRKIAEAQEAKQQPYAIQAHLKKEVEQTTQTTVTEQSTSTTTTTTGDSVNHSVSDSTNTSNDHNQSQETVNTVSSSASTEATTTETNVQEEETVSGDQTSSLLDRVSYGEQIHNWEAPAGETLRTLLIRWGEQSGWTVVWKMDRDYHLEAGVIFRGTFTEVSAALIRSFARATPAPIGTFYSGNRVLVISVQEDENAN